jgi:hypothetical protein
MPGEYMPPEPSPGRTDWPAQGRHAAGGPRPAQPSVLSPQTAPADAGQAIGHQPAGDAAPAGAGGGMAPAGVGRWAPPGPPSSPPDPAAVTGPPWPRLVAAEGTCTPPRLIRWPIAVGIVLFAGWLAAAVALRAAPVSLPSPAAVSPSSPAAVSPPSPTAAYVLTASDAHFTATFPARPQRTTKNLGTITAIAYLAQFPSHAVGVTYLALPATATYRLNRGINGIAATLPAGKVISRHALSYRGRRAEDATISSSAGVMQVRALQVGSSAYILEGAGSTRASFAHDYTLLLNTFTPTRA